MKKKCSYIIQVLLLFAVGINAQDFSMEFGTVSKAEYDLKEYGPDRNAEALVLFDKGESAFEMNFGIPFVTFTRTTRIKILNNAGLSYAEVQIPLRKHPAIFQSLISIKGYTYNRSDSTEIISALDSSQSYIEHVDEYTDLLKVPMPMAKVGSIIEYKYSYITNYFFNLPEWNFQSMIPTVYSSYTLKSSPVASYNYLLRGNREFDTVFTEASMNYSLIQRGISKARENTYVMKNLPAIVEEELVASYMDLVSSLSFQVSKIVLPNGRIEYIQSTWRRLVDNYLERKDFGKFLMKSGKKLGTVKKELGIRKLPEKEMYEQLVSYVKESFTWNYFESQTADQTVKEFFVNRTGNSSEINLFLVGLLQAAGFESAPLLISTKGNGSVNKDYPFSHQLNYLVTATKIDGRWILTDATDPLISNYDLPVKCINDDGLLVRSGRPEWLKTNLAGTSKAECTIDVSLDGNCYEASIEQRYYSLDAYLQRSTTGKDTSSARESMRGEYILARNLETAILNYESLDEPYILKSQFRHEILRIENKMYLVPFLAEGILANPFKQAKRYAPVDMAFPWMKSYISKINIPQGYEIDYLPENLQIDDPKYRFDYKVSRDGNTLTFFMSIYMKQAVFQPEYYNDLKDFYNTVVRKSREKLVLKDDVHSVL